MQIIDLTADNENAIQQTARIMLEVFRETAPGWANTMDEAAKEVRESFDTGHISRIAVDDNGDVLGWIGGIEEYDGFTWELHPLAVHPAHQGKGIGRALVQDLEKQVRQRGGLNIMLGTDDETNRTSLGGKDLYPNILEYIRDIQNYDNHPYSFYQKLGYVIVGVIPDANGHGKPDILMAKRLD